MYEFWDVYNRNRIKTGKKIRRDYDKLNEGEYHLVVHIWIINSKGELLIQQRSLNKTLPGMWASTGGSAIAGEDSLTGAQRELYEELGVLIKRDDFELIHTAFYNNKIGDVYLVKKDIDLASIKLDETEVMDCMYVTYEKMNEMIRNNEFYKNVFLDEIKIYLNTKSLVGV